VKLGGAWTQRTWLTLREHQGSHAKVETARLATAGRRALWLTWCAEDGTRVEGEASPLPGFGEDSFDLAKSELGRLTANDLEQALRTLRNATTLLGGLGCVCQELRSPSARFALEQCLLAALSQERSMPIWALLAEALGRASQTVPTLLPASAVLDPLSSDCLELAQGLAQEGVKTLKVKVGRDSDRECETLARLAHLPFRFRLDPNQAWTERQFHAALSALRGAVLDFVEDPTGELQSWPGFAERARLALDEPLSKLPYEPEALRALEVSFVVLKPMALGGFSPCLQWARVAAAVQVRPIVSHLFDGPRAFTAALHLAFALGDEDFAPGLGLHAGLDAWPEKLGFSRSWFARSTLEACASAL
jgi:L-alanine-DL-glutamate epimerase-like enolase superfamily enzyme